MTATTISDSQFSSTHQSRAMRVQTDLPSFTCPFTSSPSVMSPNHPISPTSERMAFPKIPISACSTDSEILSDFDARQSSPSLITSLFSRHPSSSCSTSSNPTPVTPTCGAKPILRRSGPDSAYGSTSASEDCGRIFEKIGLGLSSVTNGEGNALKLHEHPVLGRKRSTLTFAVKCPIASDSAVSPVSSFSRPSRSCRPFSRSPCAAKLPAWDDDEELDEEDDDEDEAEFGDFSPLFEEESDDDEGYQEDSEGGFSSDEECVGAFTDLPRWEPSARWKATHNTPRRRTNERSESTTACTSDDGSVVYRPRGRKIMIATSKPDRCSRHVSPPPSRAASPVRSNTCPPAARSPSAIGLCRRRETAEQLDGGKTPMSLAGWRSDVPVTKRSGSICPPASILRKEAAPSQSAAKVRRACTQGGTLRTATRAGESEKFKLQRRVSAPACSAISAERSGCDMRESAREGLEAFLRRGSDK